jgi:HAD superfamily phosphoserine phosphatase-like hydrolase
MENIQQTYIKNGMSYSLFKETLAYHEINPQIYPLLKYLKKNKIKTAIISSGIDEYVNPVAKELGIDLCQTNYTFSFDRKGKLQKINYLSSDQESKVIQIKEICRQFGIKPTETLFVGDSINDLKAFKLTKHGILYKRGYNDRRYKKYAWKTIKNLEEIKNF